MSEKSFYEKGFEITATFQTMNAIFEQILSTMADLTQMIHTVQYNLNHELWQLIPAILSKPTGEANPTPLGHMWQGR